MSDSSALEDWVDEAVPRCDWWGQHAPLCDGNPFERIDGRWFCASHASSYRYATIGVRPYSGYQPCWYCRRPAVLTMDTSPCRLWCQSHYNRRVGRPPVPFRSKASE